jgi:uncharacterized protein YecE (DUF72 family)
MLPRSTHLEKRAERHRHSRALHSAPPQILIGTSGYSYKGWDKTFYPPDVPKRAQLEYYETQFKTVEINATFYRLPSEGMVKGWRDRVANDFVYAIKGSRFLTHMLKLRNCAEGVTKFFDRIRLLKPKIGCILWQLPGALKCDVARLEEFAGYLPGGYRHAFEFRNPGWLVDRVYETLEKHHFAFVSVSSLGMPMDLSATSDFVYIRFHGLQGGPAHDYTREELVPWAKHIQQQCDAGKRVYVYFNNDINTRAPDNARMLAEMTGARIPG